MNRQTPYILGTGSFVPPTRITNAEILGALHATRPDGRPVHPDWLKKHLLVETRALDIEVGTVTKKSRADGGLYNGDLAVRAAHAAMQDAGVDGKQIDVVVLVSCSPDHNYCLEQFRLLYEDLGLRGDTVPDFNNLGCAGLAVGFNAVTNHLLANNDATVLLVASASPSSFMSRETFAHYADFSRRMKETGREDLSKGWSWISPAVFGDGAGAMVLRLGDDSHKALSYETHF